jgi:hypothetical protein
VKMKWITVFFYMVVLSTGCVCKKEKGTPVGPLSQINKYQVIPLFLPNETSGKEVLIDHLVEVLGKLGTVHISTNCIDHSSASCGGMLISVGEFGSAKTGSINILADAEIAINKHKVSCEAWKTLFHDPTLPYPVDEEAGIAFKKDPLVESPDLKAVITQMIEQFSEQYRKDNPGSKPTFLVYSQFSSAGPG